MISSIQSSSTYANHGQILTNTFLMTPYDGVKPNCREWSLTPRDHPGDQIVRILPIGGYIYNSVTESGYIYSSSHFRFSVCRPDLWGRILGSLALTHLLKFRKWNLSSCSYIIKKTVHFSLFTPIIIINRGRLRVHSKVVF
jgi:hypothetical protein